MFHMVKYFSKTKRKYVEVSEEEPLPVISAVPGSTVLYTAAISVTGTAVAVGTQNVGEVLLQADAGNEENILVGNSSTQVFPLAPGASITLAVSNLNRIHVKTASGTATLYFLARS